MQQKTNRFCIKPLYEDNFHMCVYLLVYAIRSQLHRYIIFKPTSRTAVAGGLLPS